MSTKDKLEEIAAAMRARWQASDLAEAPQTNPIVGEDVSAEGEPINAGTAVAAPERESQATIADQLLSPLVGLDLDTAIRLRWALRDIKAKRTKLTPVSPTDLGTLIEMGLVEYEMLVQEEKNRQVAAAIFTGLAAAGMPTVLRRPVTAATRRRAVGLEHSTALQPL